MIYGSSRFDSEPNFPRHATAQFAILRCFFFREHQRNFFGAATPVSFVFLKGITSFMIRAQLSQ
jgi:hypothetical protein